MQLAERNYEIYNKKLLAIVEALTKWRQYLLDATEKFKVWMLEIQRLDSILFVFLFFSFLFLELELGIRGKSQVILSHNHIP